MAPDHRRWLRDLLLCVSLANLYCINVWIELGNELTHYYRAVPPRAAMIGALLAVLSCLALMFWVCLSLVRAVPARWRRPALAIAVVAALWVPLWLLLAPVAADLRLSAGPVVEPIAAAVGRGGLAVVLGVATIASGVLAIRYADRWLRGARTLLALLALLLPLLALRVVWAHLQQPADAAFAGDTPQAEAPRQKTRMLWFLFDEWDYRATFGDRAGGLMLPELDRLRQEAFSASRAVGGAAMGTANVVPSLLMGRRAMEAHTAGPGELLVRLDGSSPSAAMVRWSSQPSLFDELRRLGWTTAVTAWYHPQCRVLGEKIDRCTWEPGASIYNRREYAEEVTFADRMKLIVSRQLARLPLLERFAIVDAGAEERRLRLREYSGVLESATASIDSAAFVMVHWPVPHPPPIYSRRERRLGADVPATYLDNLVLVDEIVGRFRRLIDRRGGWDDAIVLLSSDHALRRSQLPRPGARTPEERELAAAPRSLYVPVIVKLPRRHDRVTYTQPFSIMLLHDMVIELASGRIATADALAAWIDANRSRFPVPRSLLRQ